jgi:hypothetical protein
MKSKEIDKNLLNKENIISFILTLSKVYFIEDNIAINFKDKYVIKSVLYFQKSTESKSIKQKCEYEVQQPKIHENTLSEN